MMTTMQLKEYLKHLSIKVEKKKEAEKIKEIKEKREDKINELLD